MPDQIPPGFKLRRTLRGHAHAIFRIAWSPDGRTLASASNDRTVRLWPAQTGQLTITLEGHTEYVTSVSFSRDGEQLASKSYDETILIWRRDTWQRVAALKESPSTWASNLAYHPIIATVLATLGEDDTVIRIWDLDFHAFPNLNAASDRDDVLYTTAKVTLVGDSGTGKTGLGWRLAHKEFKEHPSTHGQQFWVIDEWGATREKDGTQCEAVLWDLAGQPDYRLVHALFLDDVDLALVLFDPTNRQEPLKAWSIG